ncbi:UTRA domain-containing protein [Roseisalinus antarcticus]|uniref:Putative HTH-type transcriptional regulator YurK n=1 Tax=Roseisalinus antarcticus TaxID=254357 RepID=A0A1Y5RDT0_9RHOB|nr:UTRA domain-containing protein [Roseisalinus antarcticus]SLN15168.1 putative HTH-type transcriptional regulator YurK [Roseisalinus antarcticus]
MGHPKGQETHHSRILDALLQKIVSGAWPPGFQLDRETDLAAQFCVSRMTMNKVLTQLAQDGYVVRRRRSGTFVAKARTQSAVMAINNVADEVAALGRRHRWRLDAREVRKLGAADLRLLGVRRASVPEDALSLSGVHFADDEPFCFEMRAINLHVVPGAQGVGFDREVPGSWLLQTMPWSTARNSVRAVNVHGRDAGRLDLPDGTACLEILRKTEIGGDWVTYARLLYPGEAFQLTAEFEPKAAQDGAAPETGG